MNPPKAESITYLPTLTTEELTLCSAKGHARDILDEQATQQIQGEINKLAQAIKDNPKSPQLREWNNALVINQIRLQLHNQAAVTLRLVDIIEKHSADADILQEQMCELQQQVATVTGFFASLADPENFRKIRNIAKLCPENKPIKPNENP